MAEGLKLKNISKSFGDVKIIEDLDLNIKPEEFLVLVGPSGSGKSTIIRIIAGLESQNSGTISLDGNHIENTQPKDRNVSMVFQNYALYPHKTVYDNLAFPLNMAKEEESKIKPRVNEIAKKLELDEYLKRKPKELSGGQRQRVALGRAMIRSPKVFLMDEPLSNLDAKLRAQMRTEIHRLHKELKNIFIYVTHDQIEALTLGQRIAVIDKGVIQQIDSPEEIYNNPRNTFVASFIGSPPANLLSLDPKKITGIRPEFLGITKSPDSKELNVKIKHIELLGSEYLIYGDHRGTELIAKISQNQNGCGDKIHSLFKSYKAGDDLSLYYPGSKIYEFDARSGARIG